jgi:CubicO group peptidase (beta-lactamase class C family)
MIISVVVVLATITRLLAQDQAPGEVEIKQILQDCVDKQKRAPGIVVGLIRDKAGTIISYGKASRDSTQEVNGNTVFEIGSVTKVFTALLLEKMIDARRIETG